MNLETICLNLYIWMQLEMKSMDGSWKKSSWWILRYDSKQIISVIKTQIYQAENIKCDQKFRFGKLVNHETRWLVKIELVSWHVNCDKTKKHNYVTIIIHKRDRSCNNAINDVNNFGRWLFELGHRQLSCPAIILETSKHD